MIQTLSKLKRPKCEFILVVDLKIENFRIIEFLTDVENMLTEYFRPLSTYADLDKGFRLLRLNFAKDTKSETPWPDIPAEEIQELLLSSVPKLTESLREMNPKSTLVSISRFFYQCLNRLRLVRVIILG